ncbi:MAG: hydantoinase/oxoprolinase family protein [Planctomycetota bacterium]
MATAGHTHKLLSENPDRYEDAPLQGIRDLLGVAPSEELNIEDLASVRLGTTVATNALLERRGVPTALLTTAGFGDGLEIGNQARPDLFALAICKPAPLQKTVLEVGERLDAQGKVRTPLNESELRNGLRNLRAQGITSLAICLVHGDRFPEHEQRCAEIARECGFAHISTGHRVSPLMRWVPRARTTVVDAYLSPVLQKYVRRVEGALRPGGRGPQVRFMQSHGGLSTGEHFTGKDALLSGPAGGVIGMVAVGRAAGRERLIGFDMGGTSTDVSHYAGELERTLDSEIDGVPVRVPMMHVHTVAAGGGSVLHHDSRRLWVGPDSAGADPGPACYGKGGPLAVTDAQVLLGRLQPKHFPAVFGPDGRDTLSTAPVQRAFEALAREIEGSPTPETLASGFLQIAVDNMARAIRRISVERGYDVTEYALVCFGGAGGQHACLVAETLGMREVLIHPLGGVLSALGIGLADLRQLHTEGIAQPCSESLWPELQRRLLERESRAADELHGQGVSSDAIRHNVDSLRVRGSDTTLSVPFGPPESVMEAFATAHEQRFGFRQATELHRRKPPRANPSEVNGRRACRAPAGRRAHSSRLPPRVPHRPMARRALLQTRAIARLRPGRPRRSGRRHRHHCGRAQLARGDSPRWPADPDPYITHDLCAAIDLLGSDAP